MNIRLYTLTVIAEMAQLDKETIRRYEDEGLISPTVRKNQKLYSDDDLERLKMIRRLTEELGVNLPGVEVILNMRQQILNMQNEFEKILDQMRAQILKEFNEYTSRAGRRLIESKSGKVIKVEIED